MSTTGGRILCQLKSDTGHNFGCPIDLLPLNIELIGLEKVCGQALLQAAENSQDYDEDVSYAFFIRERRVPE